MTPVVKIDKNISTHLINENNLSKQTSVVAYHIK